MLSAGHSGCGIIEDEYDAFGLVVSGVDKARYSRMHERGITHDTDDFLVWCAFSPALVESHSRPHAQARVKRGSGGQAGKRIAADVAGDVEIEFFESRERCPVWAFRAQARFPFDYYFFLLYFAFNDCGH